MIGFVRLQSLEKELAQKPEEEDAFPHYKGFWTRGSSYLLDLVFFGLFGVLIRYFGWMLLFAVVPIQWLQPMREYDESMGSALALYGLASFFAYFAIFEWLYGATLSKIIHKMRVVKTDGAPCGPLAALVRALMLLVDGFFFGIVAAISMNPPLHQRLGDRLARTVVVAAGDPLIRQPRPWTRFVAALVVYLAVALCLFVFMVWMVARAAPIDAGGATI
jgi:uncharacterized RDD family membrane protein YckC